MARLKDFLRQHRPIVALAALILLLTTIPILDVVLMLGGQWQGIPPTFTDENFYYARVQTIVKGHFTGGNPYFIEHTDGPPLVLFVGAWLNVFPQLMGLSLNTALLLNFIVWSLVFSIALYWLFRELRAPPWISVFGTVLLYIESYAHVWRAVNLQTVYPFYFLFYIALLRLIREQNRKNVILVGLVTGATFYLYAYLWQSIAITLGLLFLYTLVKKNWLLMKATLASSVIGGIIGLPVPLYAFWLSHSSPYFWESVGRLGLVNTHLPMAEVLYSGGWVGVVLALLVVLYWRVQTLREDKEFMLLSVFLGIGGLGLWVMQGSNLITGKLLETGEHVRLLILPWLLFATVAILVFIWKQRALVSRGLMVFSIAVLALLLAAGARYSVREVGPFLPSHINQEAWETEQSYAKPFAWLEQAEKNPVVVWSDPHNASANDLPIFTKHFSLYSWAGMLELVPESEILERYLVSQYFNTPTLAKLKSNEEMVYYLGRHDMPHAAKTIEREIKVCRLLSFFKTNKDCGTPPTPQSLLGEKFFSDLENKFKNDIQPHIKAYLKKYHVSYILKDRTLDLNYRPEALGAVRVYTDDRYEIYHLSYE